MQAHEFGWGRLDPAAVQLAPATRDAASDRSWPCSLAITDLTANVERILRLLEESNGDEGLPEANS